MSDVTKKANVLIKYTLRFPWPKTLASVFITSQVFLIGRQSPSSMRKIESFRIWTDLLALLMQKEKKKNPNILIFFSYIPLQYLDFVLNLQSFIAKKNI